MESSTINKIEINPQEIPYYSDKDIAYQTYDKRYENFYAYPPIIESIPDVINHKKKQQIDRILLTEVIKETYQEKGLSASQSRALQSLKQDNGFTIITAHQPSLFTGPLYFIFKICSAIKMTRELQRSYPDYQFVPVFISGGEDHDFEEINHAQVFGKTVKWDNSQGGAVGRIVLDSSFEDTIHEFLDILGEKNHGLKIKEILHKCLGLSKTYGEFNFHLVNELFSIYGLLVVNMDNVRLKRAFHSQIQDEITNRPSRDIVINTQNKLEHLGFSPQAYPREINFFYLEEGFRSRIIYENGTYSLVERDKEWTEQEIIKEIEDHPDRFSPNVVIRPLFQEFIFPNLAYIGGGGEIAYWLERKDQFDFFDIPFPMLVRRDSAMFIPSYLQRQIQDLEITPEHIFQDVDVLINNFIARNAGIDIDLSKEKEAILSQYEIIADKAQSIDPTIAKWILAESSKQEKVVDQMESRIKRSIKKREDIKVKQIRKTKEKLFPENGLQERYDNFFQYYLQHGPELIDMLIDAFDPFDNKFHVIEL